MLPIEHWITATQTPVYFVRTPTLPILELRIVFDAGSCRDGDHPGIAELTHNLLSEGTDKISAEKVAECFENVGAVFSSLVNHDMTVISLRTITLENFLKPALKTLSAIIQNPLISTQGFSHQQKLLLSYLSQVEQSPSELIENAFYKALYNKHPYASPLSGTKKSITALTPVLISAFHKKYYVAQNASLVIVGDLTQQKAKKLAETIVQFLPQGKRASPLQNAVKTAKAITKKIPYTYDATQTHVMMGQICVDFSDPLFFPLYVGNEILGGDPLISHLGQSVREKKGLVYDIRSYFLRLQYEGPFQIAFQTRTDKAQQAIEIVYKTLRKFMLKPPSEMELQAVQDHITKGYGLNFDSNRAIASNLMMLAFYQLPLNYFETFPTNILAVTSEQIFEAFRAKLNLEKMVEVCLGGKLKCRVD